jgi:hypothetical protein
MSNPCSDGERSCNLEPFLVPQKVIDWRTGKAVRGRVLRGGSAMNIDLPASYVAAREACETAGKRYATAMDKALDAGISPVNDEEFLSARAAMNRAREELTADPHQQWLEEVRRDEMTAHKQMLARQPRTVTGLTLGPDEYGEPACHRCRSWKLCMNSPLRRPRLPFSLMRA